MKDYIVYTDEGVLILSAPNLETAYELANEWDLDIDRIELAQSYNKEPNFGIKDDEEENKWWIDYDLDEGVGSGLC
jgi:hypothetical protein